MNLVHLGVKALTSDGFFRRSDTLVFYHGAIGVLSEEGLSLLIPKTDGCQGVGGCRLSKGSRNIGRFVWLHTDLDCNFFVFCVLEYNGNLRHLDLTG